MTIVKLSDVKRRVKLKVPVEAHDVLIFAGTEGHAMPGCCRSRWTVFISGVLPFTANGEILEFLDETEG